MTMELDDKKLDTIARAVPSIIYGLLVLGGALLFLFAAEGIFPGVHAKGQAEPLLRYIGAMMALCIAAFGLWGLFRLQQRLLQITSNSPGDNFRYTHQKTINEILLDYVRHNSNLDFVAYYKNGRLLHEVNPHLDLRLRKFKVARNRNDQVVHFIELAAGLHKAIDVLNNVFKSLEQGVLVRTVFDVAKGGFFYYHLDDDHYLFGATVDQASMDDNQSDRAMRELSAAIREFESIE